MRDVASGGVDPAPETCHATGQPGVDFGEFRGQPFDQRAARPGRQPQQIGPQPVDVLAGSGQFLTPRMHFTLQLADFTPKHGQPGGAMTAVLDQRTGKINGIVDGGNGVPMRRPVGSGPGRKIRRRSLDGGRRRHNGGGRLGTAAGGMAVAPTWSDNGRHVNGTNHDTRPPR